MIYDKITAAVSSLLKKYGTRNPHELCELLDIVLLPTPLGKEDTAIKGFFLESRRIKTITYNSDMPDKACRIILGHELGHAMLHANTGLFVSAT